MPQTAVVLTIDVPSAEQKSNLNAGVNTAILNPGIPANMPGGLTDGAAQVFLSAPRLGMPIIFG